jgi:hypothetical protein
MRNGVDGRVLSARAIAGLHVVTLAWDFAADHEDDPRDLLGFAIERAELQQGQVVERYWLRGIKRFRDKDEGVPPGTPVPTSEHPIQSFQWGDYTVKPETSYQYKVVPVYGSPKLLDLDDASSVTVGITTETEQGAAAGAGRPRHDIYFNRGVAGSQAYARKFGKVKPDPAHPESEQMAWLSRGLFEALVGFIKRAAGPDAGDYKLRAMFYEFRYAPVADAFKLARDNGADVDIRYEAQSYKDDNEATIAQAGIEDICRPQKSRGGIRHNKFIVLVHDDRPVGVWTGSTNVSSGGIFGHSNVGHAVWDETVAQRYLEYWTRLADPNVKPSPLRTRNLAAEQTPARHAPAPADRILTLFSPRDGKDAPATLQWYADVMAMTQRIMCITFAFNLDDTFVPVLEQTGDTLRYVLVDKAIDPAVEKEITRSGNTVYAAGAKLEKGDFEPFLGEVLTGFNKNQYIHDKFMLVDPLGHDPVVVTGSANFSAPSQVANDENMLVVRGDTRVADIYFGEFMRLFDHLYTRYIVRKLKDAGRQDPDAGYLKVTQATWLPPHLGDGPKSRRRRYFMELAYPQIH